MPAIQRSPVCLGFDDHRQAVLRPDGPDDDPHPRTRPLTRGTPVTPCSRPSLLVRSRRSSFNGSDSSFESFDDGLNLGDVSQSRSTSRGSVSRLNFSPLVIGGHNPRDPLDSRTSTSTQFDVPALEDVTIDESSSSGTLISGSNSTSDHEDQLSPTAREIIDTINNMPPTFTPEMEAASMIRNYRKDLLLAVSIWDEEFKESNPLETPIDELKHNIQTAKEWKDKILRAQLECEEVPDLQELRTNAGIARTGFLQYITAACKELRSLEGRPGTASPPLLNTSATTVVSATSGTTGSKAKIDRIERYVDQTVGDIQELIDQLDQLTLDAPETQLEFRNLQDRVKMTSKEVEYAKKHAKELIDQAIDCDMVDESTRMEDVYRILEKKEIDLMKNIQELKDQYGIVGDSKNNDLKYPTFSGEQTEKYDFFSFKEDWEAVVAVKAPSKAEQLRLLTRQCLTGTARAACRHMETVELVFEHLKDGFGNVSDLFSHRVDEIRRLGTCSGPNEKKRKWSLEVRSQLTYLSELSKKHGMYEDLYTHQIVAEIQESLPPDILKEFLKQIRRQPGRASKKQVFELLLDYMDEVVSLFNHQHTYRLDHGVDPDKYYKTKLEAKKSPNISSKPMVKVKNYSSMSTTSTPTTSATASTASSGRPKQPRGSQGNGVYVSPAYVAPAMRTCRICGGQHTHVYYCDAYSNADILVDRVKVVQKLLACFRCLRMDSEIDFSNRSQWEKNHEVECQSEWVCQFDECSKRPKNRQYHFSLCRWHIDKNKKKQPEFIKKLDPAQSKPGISFFLNFPSYYNMDPVASQFDVSIPGCEILDDVNDPSIFMLQNHVVQGRKMLLFYDSGCMGSAISDRGAILLDSVCVRPGPTTMNVAGGKTVLLEGGDEQFLLDLAAPNTKATITALKMPHVTTKFPLWRICDAWEEIQRDYEALKPKLEPLPPAPGKLGGDEIDIMIGIRYMKYFPILVCTLPCGLGIHRSLISAPNGELTVLGGPHPAWRHATDLIGFMGVTSFFTAEMRAFQAVSRSLQHLDLIVDHVPVEPEWDVIDEDLLQPDLQKLDVCNADHCDKHTDVGEWIIPPSWDIECSAFGVRQESIRFSEAENLGTDISYRCVRCRNCNRCRQGENLESVSLREEQEQYLIDSSVTFNYDKGFLIAVLPFISDPRVSLNPNRYTAEKILESQMRQLGKNDQARLDVVAAHEKLRSRGYVAPLSDLDPKQQEWIWANPNLWYLIPWRAVWKATSLSTPCRMVFDASSKTPGGESLNQILAKGENKLSKITDILLRFRSKPGAFTCDVKMAYNQVRLDPSCYHYQLYLWRTNLDLSQPVTVMVVKTLIYGVKSSGNQLFSGLEKVADYSISHFPEHDAGAETLKRDGYVDDIIHSDQDDKTARSTAQSLNFVLSTANLAVKAYTFAGSAPDPEVSTDNVHVGLVGMNWDPKQDLIGIDVKDLFFGKPKRGVLPELVSGDIGEALHRNFTRRNLLGKVAGIYDPIGLVTPITSRLKLDLHDLCLENLDWDDQVPDSYLEKWIRNLEDIQSLKEIRFRRTIIPQNAASLQFELIVSSDASKSIAVASVHTRVPLVSGGFQCQLYTAKSKIVRYSTIPRGELRAAVMSASLGHSVKHSLQSQITEVVYVTDSTIVLHWINHDERPLETAVRNSVIEIRRLSDLRQWFHIDGALNIADLGTRHAEVSEIVLTSEWQNGKTWMCLPLSEMPLRSVDEINLTSEEKRTASLETKGTVMYNDLPEMIPRVSERYKFSQFIFDPNKRSWTSSVRVLAYVIRFIAACRPQWKPVWFPPVSPVCPANSGYPFLRKNRPHLTEYDVKRGENYYFIKATQEVIHFSSDKEYRDSFIIKNGIYHYVGRILDSQEISSPEDTMFDLTPLSFVQPIVDRYSPVAYSVMLHCHEAVSHHRSATATLLESRYVAYILRGRDLSTEITKSCRFCIRHRSKLIEVELGKLHQTRLTIAPVFHVSQVDLFGPMTAICEHQHRSTVKVYGVVFKDPASCAVAIYVMQDYSAAAFLQAYTRFASRYGHPSEIRIDEGSQLVSACKKMELSMLDITDFLSINHKVGVTYSTCAVAGHNSHGMVERSIKEIKNLLNKVYKGLRLDILSFETCFSWIASELNNLPICIGSRVENLDHVDLITPSRLLLGRNNRRALSGYVRLSTPSRLIDQMDKIYEVWWNVWKTEKLVDFIPQPSKWKRTNEQLVEGDIVIFLKSDAEHRLGDPVWRIARVHAVEVSEDGLARTATLEYRNPSEKTFRTTRRSVRTIIVVHREDQLDVLQALERAALEDLKDAGPPG